MLSWLLNVPSHLRYLILGCPYGDFACQLTGNTFSIANLPESFLPLAQLAGTTIFEPARSSGVPGLVAASASAVVFGYLVYKKSHAKSPEDFLIDTLTELLRERYPNLLSNAKAAMQLLITQETDLRAADKPAEPKEKIRAQVLAELPAKIKASKQAIIDAVRTPPALPPRDPTGGVKAAGGTSAAVSTRELADRFGKTMFGKREEVRVVDRSLRIAN